MFPKGKAVRLEAVPDIDQDMENLEPWLWSASGRGPGMEFGTNIAIIHNIIFQEVIQQGQGCGHLANRLYFPHQIESADLEGAGIITIYYFLRYGIAAAIPNPLVTTKTLL